VKTYGERTQASLWQDGVKIYAPKQRRSGRKGAPKGIGIRLSCETNRVGTTPTSRLCSTFRIAPAR